MEKEIYLPKEIINEIGKYSYPDDYDELKEKIEQLKNKGNICYECLKVTDNPRLGEDITKFRDCSFCGSFFCNQEKKCTFKSCVFCRKIACYKCSKKHKNKCKECDFYLCINCYKLKNCSICTKIGCRNCINDCKCNKSFCDDCIITCENDFCSEPHGCDDCMIKCECGDTYFCMWECIDTSCNKCDQPVCYKCLIECGECFKNVCKKCIVTNKNENFCSPKCANMQ